VEVRSIFPDAEWRARVAGKEVDVLLPRQKVGIEVDGHPWHQGKADRDRDKLKHLARNGYRLVRLRDSRLEPQRLSDDDVIYKDGRFRVEDVQSLVRAICGKKRSSKVNAYLRRTRFAEARGYRKAIACLPSPPAGESLANLFFELCREWDADANAPLCPTMFTPQSHVKVRWKCPECGHRWQAAIGSRATGRGCPNCAVAGIGERRASASIRKYGTVADNARLMSLWFAERNERAGLKPNRVSVQSPTRAWWRCPEGHEWEAEIRNLYRGSGCRQCYLAGRRRKSIGDTPS
jgi:rubrerythrin